MRLGNTVLKFPSANKGAFKRMRDFSEARKKLKGQSREESGCWGCSTPRGTYIAGQLTASTLRASVASVAQGRSKGFKKLTRQV